MFFQRQNHKWYKHGRFFLTENWALVHLADSYPARLDLVIAVWVVLVAHGTGEVDDAILDGELLLTSFVVGDPKRDLDIIVSQGNIFWIYLKIGKVV